MRNSTYRGFVDTARPLPFQMRNARWLEGEGDDTGDGGDDSDDAGDDDGADDGTEDDGGADELGDAGKQALDRMKGKWRQARDELRTFKALGLTPDEIRALQGRKNDEGDGTDADEVRRQAERDAVTKANGRIVRSEIKAAAAGKLADPKDALNFINPDDFEVDDDGNVDEDEIAEAIDDLLTRKPYLAAQGGPRKPKPDRSQGETGNGTATVADEFATWSKQSQSL